MIHETYDPLTNEYDWDQVHLAAIETFDPKAHTQFHDENGIYVTVMLHNGPRATIHLGDELESINMGNGTVLNDSEMHKTDNGVHSFSDGTKHGDLAPDSMFLEFV